MRIICWNCRGVGNPATVRDLKQLLVANDPNIIFFCETKINANKFDSIRRKCRMEGCLAVKVEGKSGRLVMMWKDSKMVEIQTYCSNHIDLLIHVENDSPICFTGFYGNTDPNKRQCSWNMLRRVGKSVKEKWIIWGDFNAILDEAKKEGARRKSTVLMEDFHLVADELSMVDLKIDNGWFTWVNNREGIARVKEILDRFLMSTNDVNSFTFLETRAIRNEEAKMIIKEAWQSGTQETMEKIMNVGKELGRWQYMKLKQMHNQIGSLQAKINRIIDGQGSNYEGNKLKAMRLKLGNLLDTEEKYWAQRSRVNWLKEGDMNTRFFHVRAFNRRKKNNIARPKDINGFWRENTVDICKAINEYFQLLFKSNLNSNNVLNLDYIERCISGEDNDKLLKDFMDSEIKEACSQMDPRKAPRIDWLLGNFFKENWDVVGEDVIILCLDILRGEKNVDCLNDTIIILILKIKEPVDMTNFRPISICRVIYKIVTKVLANRMRETLPLCISQNQSAFVSRRMVHDNILIAHELVHYLQSGKNGSNKGFVIKLDMSKAYDRVEWNFIEEKEALDRQTLSPYLFLFYMEAFSRLLIHAQNNNMLKGIQASINVPRINHLFFADDALLFVQNKKKGDVEEIVNIIASFSRVSGQEVNKDMFMIMFSLKTLADHRHLFSFMLGIRTVDKLDSYLGLPLPVSRKKSLALSYIINRRTCRVRSCSKHLLSYGGKKVFIKAIIQAILTYAFSVFLALKGIIEELHSQMGRMWWTNNYKARGWAIMAWEKMCYPKDMGGMGFQNLHLFNLALLGRQVWQLMSQQDTLCFKVLSPKYFPDGDVFSYKWCDKPSFTWVSIAKAVDVLNDDFIWQVGDGNMIDFRRDHWGVEGITGESAC
ncbi:uncharacterized protein LOC108451662 [Gossypium arboreum]|uniref:uncharacterized protein LOC108451662 n=1 Tax=Gossypium arboreum TaxID=29729 RepID=UPI00081932D0|nr:uncharacterized protein LOC108451662 [Gossypium arboreum]